MSPALKDRGWGGDETLLARLWRVPGDSDLDSSGPAPEISSSLIQFMPQVVAVASRTNVRSNSLWTWRRESLPGAAGTTFPDLRIPRS